MKLPLRLAASAAILLFARLLAAQDAPALVLENGGLKNTYRVVFEEFDTENHMVRGALEILGDDDGREKPHTRIPFAGEIKSDAKDKKAEVLTVNSAALFAFFPPTDKAKASPTVTWKLTGRTSGKPVLKAKLWDYDADKETWVLTEMEFGKAES